MEGFMPNCKTPSGFHPVASMSIKEMKEEIKSLSSSSGMPKWASEGRTRILKETIEARRAKRKKASSGEQLATPA
jgi:hypothetical protein